MPQECSFDNCFDAEPEREGTTSLRLSHDEAQPASERERRRRLAQKLRDARAVVRSMDRYVATIAHELRAPLTSLRLLTEDLADDQTSRIGDRQNDLVHLMQIVRGMAETLDNLVDGARLTQGDATWSAFDLCACCNEAMDLVRPQLSPGVRLAFSGNHEPMALRGDGDAIRRLLVNLLCNAARHTKSGQITVCASTRPGRLHLSISDTGGGIDEGVLGRLGEPFSRGPDRRGGSGLGLWLCRTIAAMHGGRLSIASARRLGTTVVATLQTDLGQPVACRNPPSIAIIPMVVTGEAA